ASSPLAPASAPSTRSDSPARSHVCVQAAHCAPRASAVRWRSSSRSATVRAGSSAMSRLYNCDIWRGMAAVLRRATLLAVVLGVLWGLWEGWHWIGTHFALTWPFTVDDTTMPHLHRIVQALFQLAQVKGSWLLDIVWQA